MTDGNITQGALDSTLFPGVPDDVAVHEGFRDVHAQSAQAILDEVNKLIGDKGTSKVITVSLMPVDETRFQTEWALL